MPISVHEASRTTAPSRKGCFREMARLLAIIPCLWPAMVDHGSGYQPNTLLLYERIQLRAVLEEYPESQNHAHSDSAAGPGDA